MSAPLLQTKVGKWLYAPPSTKVRETVSKLQTGSTTPRNDR